MRVPTETPDEKMLRIKDRITAILNEEDVAAFIVMHTPGSGIAMTSVRPTFSRLAKTGDGQFKFQLKTPHEDGGRADEMMLNTIEMLQFISTAGAREMSQIISLYEFVLQNEEKIMSRDSGMEGIFDLNV